MQSDHIGTLRDIIYEAELQRRKVKAYELYWIGLVSEVEMQKILYDMLVDTFNRGVLVADAMWWIRDAIRNNGGNV